MAKNESVALFFGSFNPIHKGHTQICRKIFYQKKFNFKQIWLIPSPQNPFKKNSFLIDIKDRLAMIKKVIKNKPYLRLSLIELQLEKPNYTYATLQKLNKIYPKKKFSLILGEDNLKNFNNWKESNWILENFPLIIFPRDEVNSPKRKDGFKGKSVSPLILQKLYRHSKINFLRIEKIYFSASKVRETLRKKLNNPKVSAIKQINLKLKEALHYSTLKYLETKKIIK